MIYFSVYDKAAKAFMPMFPAVTRAAAIRMVEDAARDQGGQFIKHLLDYELYEIGTFKEAEGRFSQDTGHPVRLVSLVEFKSE